MDYRNQTNMAQSLANQVCVEVPSSELDVVKNRLEEVMNFVAHQGERIEGIEIKLNGGGGSAGQTAPAAPRPVPNGTIGQMGQVLDDIMARLQRTDAAVSRLRSAI